MIRKVIFFLVAWGLAGAAAAELVDNGSFENGLVDWTQDSASGAGSFEAVPNGGSHSEDIGCAAPPGFPGSGDFWAVSCQDDPDVHVLYQDILVPAGGGVLRMVAGVDMCSVIGGPCTINKQWSGDEAVAPGATGRFFGTRHKGIPAQVCSSIAKGDGDCARIDLVDPAADVLDQTAGLLLPIGFAENQDFPPEPSGDIPLNPWAGQTVRLRFWVQANNGEVALQVDTVDGFGHSQIPTLQPLGLALLLLILGAVGAVWLRRRVPRG